MAMVGMDIGAVKALATRMRSTADEITSTVDGLKSALDGTEWKGADRDKFSAAWDGEAPKLKKIAADLQQTAEHLDREAQQQEAASGAGG